MPSGATVSTQPTSTSIASAIPWNQSTTASRRAGSRRVSAIPSASVKTTSGSIAPSTAALSGLMGMVSSTRWSRVGIWRTDSAVDTLLAESRRLAATWGAIASRSSEKGVTSAAKAPVASRRSTNTGTA